MHGIFISAASLLYRNLGGFGKNFKWSKEIFAIWQDVQKKSDFISSVSCRFRGRPKIFHLNVEDNVETEIKKMMLSTVVFFLLMSHRVINKLFYNWGKMAKSLHTVQNICLTPVLFKPWYDLTSGSRPESAENLTVILWRNQIFSDLIEILQLIGTHWKWISAISNFFFFFIRGVRFCVFNETLAFLGWCAAGYAANSSMTGRVDGLWRRYERHHLKFTKR